MDLKLNGQIVGVTGGGQGIGEAIAIALASEGVNIANDENFNTRKGQAARRN